MAAFPTIVPTADLALDRRMQAARDIQAQQVAAQKRISDEIDAHAAEMNRQAMEAEKARAQAQISDQMDQVAQRHAELQDQHSDPSSPFSPQGFAKAFEGFLQATPTGTDQTPQGAPATADTSMLGAQPGLAMLGPTAGAGGPGGQTTPQGSPANATASAIAAGAQPSDLQFAQQHLGSQDYINLCEKFVENSVGRTGEYGSAAQALQAAQQAGQASPDIANAPKGSVIYYAPAPENGGAGHAAIALGDGQNVLSATSKGVMTTPISAFQAKPVAWVPSSFLQGGASGSAAGIGDADPTGAGMSLDPNAYGTPPAQNAVQYNEQTPTGWQQVTHNVDTGDFLSAPTTAPTPDAQANYAAQNDLTSGFTNPSVGQSEAGMSIPLLAQPDANLAPQIPTESAAPPAPEPDPAAKLAATGPEGAAVAARLTGQPVPTPGPAPLGSPNLPVAAPTPPAEPGPSPDGGMAGRSLDPMGVPQNDAEWFQNYKNANADNPAFKMGQAAATPGPTAANVAGAAQNLPNLFRQFADFIEGKLPNTPQPAPAGPAEPVSQDQNPVGAAFSGLGTAANAGLEAAVQHGVSPELAQAVKQTGSNIADIGRYQAYNSPDNNPLTSIEGKIGESIGGINKVGADLGRVGTEAFLPPVDENGQPMTGAQREATQETRAGFLNPVNMLPIGAKGGEGAKAVENAAAPLITAAGEKIAPEAKSAGIGLDEAANQAFDELSGAIDRLRRPAAAGAEQFGPGAASASDVRGAVHVETPAAGQQLADTANSAMDLVAKVKDSIQPGAPIEAVPNALSRVDTAIQVQGGALSRAIDAAKLTPEEDLQVARLREGNMPLSQASPKAVDVANATDNVAKATYQAAKDANAEPAYVEGYYSHLARRKGETGAAATAFTPSELSSFTKFGMSRKRDAAGNPILSNLDEFKTFLEQNHPELEVVTDPGTIAEAHFVGLGKSANHANAMNFLQTVADTNTGKSVLLTDAERAQLANQAGGAADYLAQNYRKVDLPASMSRYVYRGKAPEEGTIAVGKRGVIGGAENEGQTVVQQQPIVWARNDVADMLDRYVAESSPWSTNPVANAKKALDGYVVGMKLFNPIVHPLNVVSDMLSALPRSVVKGSLPGYISDLAKAREISNDPNQLAHFAMDHDAAFSTATRFASDLADRMGTIGKDPNAAQQVWNSSVGALQDLNHKVVFEKVVQPALIHTILQAERQGYSPQAASALASVKMAGIKPQQLDGFQRWVTEVGTFAPSWTNGTFAQMASTVAGRKGLTMGGYGYKLTPAEQSAVAGGLRTDYLSGQGMMLATSALINHQLSGHWPWDPEQGPGRLLDIDTGQKDPQGNEIYVTNPLFRRQADLLKLASIPNTPVAAATGTNSVEALAGKAAPSLSMGGALATGSQYLTPSTNAPYIQGGPPIMGLNETQQKANPNYQEDWQNRMLQVASQVANDFTPSNVSSSLATKEQGTGIKSQPELNINAPFGVNYREGTGVTPPNPGSPKDVGMGVLGAVGGVRQVTGPRYQNLQEYQQANLEKAYGPKLVKLFSDAGAPLYSAGPTAVIGNVGVNMGTAEQRQWEATKRAALEQIVNQPSVANVLAHSDTARQKYLLGQYDKKAGEEASAKVISAIPVGDPRRFAFHGSMDTAPGLLTAPAA